MFRICSLLLCASTLLACGHEIKSWPSTDSERASGETVEIFKNDFVKPNEQSSSSLEYSAMARNCTFKNDLSLATRTYPLQAVKKLCASGPIIVKCVPAAASAAKVEVSAPEAFIQYMQVKESAGVLQLGYEDLQIFKKRGHSYVRFGKSGVELRLGDDASGSLQTVVTVCAPLPSGLDASAGVQLQFPKNPSVDAPFSLDLSSGAVFSWSGELRSPSKAEFDLSSGGVVKGAELKCKEFSCDLSSGAVVGITSLNCRHLDAEGSSGAVLSISGGQCDDAELDTSSGAIMNLDKLKTGTVEAEASSAGIVNVPLTSRLVYSQSSGGKVSWQGKPQVTKR